MNTHRFSKLPDDGDPWAPNNLLTPEQKKNISWTPVGQATDKKLRPQPTKTNSFKSGPSNILLKLVLSLVNELLAKCYTRWYKKRNYEIALIDCLLIFSNLLLVLIFTEADIYFFLCL